MLAGIRKYLYKKLQIQCFVDTKISPLLAHVYAYMYTCTCITVLIAFWRSKGGVHAHNIGHAID